MSPQRPRTGLRDTESDVEKQRGAHQGGCEWGEQKGSGDWEFKGTSQNKLFALMPSVSRMGDGGCDSLDSQHLKPKRESRSDIRRQSSHHAQAVFGKRPFPCTAGAGILVFPSARGAERGFTPCVKERVGPRREPGEDCFMKN